MQKLKIIKLKTPKCQICNKPAYAFTDQIAILRFKNSSVCEPCQIEADAVTQGDVL